MLIPYRKERLLRSESQAFLDIPKTNLKSYGDRAFCAVAPTLWNKLPANMRHLKSLEPFKKELKTHLFKLAYK